MNLVFIYLFLLISAGSCAISNQLINAMKEQAQKISKLMPKDYQKLVNNIKANGLNGYDQFAEKDFDEMMKKYNFSASISKQFQMASFSQSIEFQAFHLSLKNTYSDVQEFIGAASNYKGIIKIAFLQVFAEGTPVPQYESYRCCHTCWLVGSCCNTCHREIGMKPDQIDTITDALRATAYSKVTDFLNNPPEKFANYTKEQQKLEDQNKWDEEMSKYAHCEILKEKDCLEYYFEASGRLKIEQAKQFQKGIVSNMIRIMMNLINACQILQRFQNILTQSLVIYASVRHMSYYQTQYDLIRKKSGYPMTKEFCYSNYFSSVK